MKLLIIDNEIQKLSRNRKRRIDSRNKIIDDMKLLIKKIKSEKKRNIKISIKLNN